LTYTQKDTLMQCFISVAMGGAAATQSALHLIPRFAQIQ